MKPTPCYKVNLNRRHSKLLVIIAFSRNFLVMNSSCLLFICIFLGITAAEPNISCVHCVGETMKTCQGTPKKCPLETDECITVRQLTKIGAREISYFMRLCGNCSQYKTGSVRFDKGILMVNTSCCNKNECMPDVPTIPPVKNPPKDQIQNSRLVCKSCYAENARNCDCNVFVNCSIGETKCISRHIHVTTKPKGGYKYIAAIRGCTNEEMCEFNVKELQLNTTTVKYTISCSDDADSIHKNLLPLILTAALYNKITITT
ncbi:hypothetical protein PRIEUP_LOCUS14794 [Pristimantis euphronides]